MTKPILLADSIGCGFHSGDTAFTKTVTRYSAMPIPDIRAEEMLEPIAQLSTDHGGLPDERGSQFRRWIRRASLSKLV